MSRKGKPTKKEPKPRSGIAVAAMSRKSGGPMKHRLEPKGGARNEQAEALKDLPRHCANGSSCLLGKTSQGPSGYCDCNCCICFGLSDECKGCEGCERIKLQEAVSHVKPITAKRAEDAKKNTEQEFCGGVDIEPVDEEDY